MTPMLAPFACQPSASRGRRHAEGMSTFRSPFQRDRDRIIHSSAFRRLKHKTQVFIEHEGDYYRTRLTHSLEVAQVARTISGVLGLNTDLAECIALAHDLGHTPFGHTGEDALARLMAPYGGFDHNAQALRVVTRLERRYAEFDGLNLCWETLEGLVKHNGPLVGPDGAGLKAPLPQSIRDFDALFPLHLAGFASLEAQVAAIADDIAYDAHDIDDGLRSGLLTLDMLEGPAFTAELLAIVRDRYPALDPVRTGHELMRRQITRMVEDVIAEAQARLAAVDPASPEAVRAAPRAIAAFSPDMQAKEKELKTFLYANLYRHPDVMAVRARAERIVTDLFEVYFDDPQAMPEGWRGILARAGDAVKARHVADFLAGMTDTYALKEHRRLFDHTPDIG